MPACPESAMRVNSGKCRNITHCCRLIQQETTLARKAAQASAALPGIQASLEQTRAQGTAWTQKAASLRPQRQRLQVQGVLCFRAAGVPCDLVRHVEALLTIRAAASALAFVPHCPELCPKEPTRRGLPAVPARLYCIILSNGRPVAADCVHAGPCVILDPDPA